MKLPENPSPLCAGALTTRLDENLAEIWAKTPYSAPLALHGPLPVVPFFACTLIVLMPV